MMKKWQRKYIIAMGIVLGVTISGLIFLICCNNRIAIELSVSIKNVILLLCVFIMAAMLGYYAIYAIVLMKKGAHNIKECDDSLFTKIDKYKSCWTESKENYIKQIQIINLIYKEEGEVDRLVKNQEIERLYARYSFLDVQSNLHDEWGTLFYSLIISVIASFVCQMLECQNTVIMIGWMVVIMLSFFMLALSKYAERGQDGSYKYLISQYEKKLLTEKIEKLERDLLILEADEEILETKQIVINELINIAKRKYGKKKKEVLQDIKCIEQLNLCMGNYSGFYKSKIYVQNQICYLVYDSDKGKENNYMGERNLVNQHYSILFHILEKYNLISYFEK